MKVYLISNSERNLDEVIAHINFDMVLVNDGHFSSKTAVNGTLCALGDYGVPEKMFSLTLENMTMGTAVKFRERLFIKKEHL